MIYLNKKANTIYFKFLPRHIRSTIKNLLELTDGERHVAQPALNDSAKRGASKKVELKWSRSRYQDGSLAGRLGYLQE